MRRLFGSSQPKAPPPNLNEAIANIDSRGETMEKKVSKLDGELVKIRDQMNKMRDGPSKNLLKQKAIRIIKQKKQYENQRDQLSSQSFNMEQSNFAIQGMKDNQITISAMKSGLKTMQKEYKKFDIDNIEALHDDMEDMLEINNEIQDALSRQYDSPDIDETELEAELNALNEELGDTSYLDEAISAPNVPTSGLGEKIPTTDSGIAVDEFGLPKIPNPPQSG